MIGINDTASGRKSFTALIAWWAFLISAFKFIFSGAVVTWGPTRSIHFGSVDAGLMGAFLGACLALYGGRRYTDTIKPKVDVIVKPD